MKRPYLTPVLDAGYQLSKTRDGCWGLWGKQIYKGNDQGYSIYFRKIGFYPTGQAEGGPAIEIFIKLPAQYMPLLEEISKGYLYTWLSQLPSARSDLLERNHSFGEYWKTKQNQLSVTIVWYYDPPDWTIIPDVVDRLISVTKVIETVSSKS